MTNESIESQLAKMAENLRIRPGCIRVVTGFYVAGESDPDLITGWWVRATYQASIELPPAVGPEVAATTGLIFCMHLTYVDEVRSTWNTLWDWRVSGSIKGFSTGSVVRTLRGHDG